MTVSPDAIVQRADVLWRRTLDGVLIRRPPAAAEVVKLAGTGSALWDALSDPIRFADLCEVLAGLHDVGAQTIAADIEPVVEDLAERGVVLLG